MAGTDGCAVPDANGREQARSRPVNSTGPNQCSRLAAYFFGAGAGLGPNVTPAAASFISRTDCSMMAFSSAESFTTGLPLEKSIVLAS